MFLGVVCPQIPHFSDGKLLLQHVSERRECKRDSKNQNFVANYEVNRMLKVGQWKLLYPKGLDISISDFLNIIQDTYMIDKDIGEDLCFIYATQTKTKKGMLKNWTVTLNPKNKMEVF